MVNNIISQSYWLVGNLNTLVNSSFAIPCFSYSLHLLRACHSILTNQHLVHTFHKNILTTQYTLLLVTWFTYNSFVKSAGVHKKTRDTQFWLKFSIVFYASCWTLPCECGWWYYMLHSPRIIYLLT